MAYQNGIPTACPPADATQINQPLGIYRAVKNDVPVDRDFKSWVELNLRQANPNECAHWGLSVWLTREAADHGRQVSPLLGKKRLAFGQLDPGDGCHKVTPSNDQPEHCTLWYRVGCVFLGRFAVIAGPAPAVDG